MWPFTRSARDSVISSLERFVKKNPEYQRRNWGEFARTLDTARRLPNPIKIEPYMEEFRNSLIKIGEHVIYEKLVDYLIQHKRPGKE